MTKKQSESITKPLGYLPQILDPCCGGRMFYFDKQDQRVLCSDIRREEHVLPCPLGQPGDRLWVKEAFARHPEYAQVAYRADSMEFEDAVLAGT